MKPLLRRLRGAFGVATAWAVVGAAFGFGLALVAYLEGSGINTTPLWRAALYWGVAGFIGGGAFSAVLAAAYRDTRVQDLPRSRVALLGALAGMVFPLGLLGLVVLSGSRAYPPSPWVGVLGVLGGLGAASAAGTLRIARGQEPLAVPASGAGQDPRLVGLVTCPSCGSAALPSEARCQNYPRGRLRSQCGFDLTGLDQDQVERSHEGAILPGPAGGRSGEGV